MQVEMQVEKIRVERHSLAELMSDIRSGRIRVPRFQRDFIWERKRIQELLDSMYREFPIGTIFLWEAPSSYNDMLRTVDYLGQPPVEHNRSYSLILDGQQRLTSLYVVVYGLSIEEENYTKIVADLSKTSPDENIFQYRDPDNKRWVSVRDLLAHDFAVYNALPNDDYKQQFARCNSLLRNYPFSVVSVRDMDLDQAIEIFERINRLGRRLTRYDLVTASVLTDTFDLRERTEQDVIEPLRNSFGEINETNIPQALALNIRGKTEHSTQMDLKADEVQQKWEITVETLKLAVDLVKTSFGVIRSDFLPYDAMLPVLAYYFYYADTKSVKSPEHLAQIESWFWRTAFSERYSGASQTRMSEDAAWIRRLVDVGQPYEYPLTISVETLIQGSMTYTTYAARNGILALLNLQRPLNFKNASEVSISGEHFSKFTRAERHHIFPAEYLKSQGYPTRAVHQIPNFAFIPADVTKWVSNRPPSEYMAWIRDNYGIDHFERVMRSHLIPIGENSGIWTDNYERFLRQRAELIVREIRRRCGISDVIAEEYRNPIIDKIEQGIRETIHTNLGNTFGPEYWDTCIPNDVEQKIDERIVSHCRKTPGVSKQQFDTPRARLDFCDISEYAKIIFRNWSAFSSIFRSKTELERTLDDFREFRNATKHNRGIDPLLEHRAQAAVIWLGRALEIDLSEYDVISN